MIARSTATCCCPPCRMMCPCSSGSGRGCGAVVAGIGWCST